MSEVVAWNVGAVRIIKELLFDVGAPLVLLFLACACARGRVQWALRPAVLVVTCLVAFLCFRQTAAWLAAPLLDAADDLSGTARASGCREKHPLIVLGGGAQTHEVLQTATANRVVTAAALLRAGSPRLVVLSGGPASESVGVPESVVMERVLRLELGERAEAFEIAREEKSLNTYQNAAYSAALLEARSLGRSVTLLTSAVHLPRAVRTFSALGFDVCAVAAPSPEIRPAGLVSFHNGMRTVQVLNEYMGTLGYRLRGWN